MYKKNGILAIPFKLVHPFHLRILEKGTVPRFSKRTKEPFSFGKNGSVGSAKGQRNRSGKGKERFPKSSLQNYFSSLFM